MELQLFMQNELALHFYYSKESINDDTVNIKNLCLVFPGLPSTVDKEYFVNRVNKDTAFLSVSYYGTWMSGGSFSPESVRQTIRDVVSFAKLKKGIKIFDNKNIYWDYEDLFVLGYSFAGNFVLNSNLKQKEITSVILCAPLIYLDKHTVGVVLKNDADKFFDSNASFLQFLERGYPYALRGIKDQAWTGYFSGTDGTSKISIVENYPPIYIIHGTEDKQVSPLFSEYFNNNYPTISTLELHKGIGHTKEMFQNPHLHP